MKTMKVKDLIEVLSTVDSECWISGVRKMTKKTHLRRRSNYHCNSWNDSSTVVASATVDKGLQVMRIFLIIPVVFVLGCGLIDMPREFTDKLEAVASLQSSLELALEHVEAQLDNVFEPAERIPLQEEMAKIEEQLGQIPRQIAEVKALAQAAVDQRKTKIQLVGKSIFDAIGGGMKAIGIPGGGLAAWGLTSILGSLMGRKKKNATVT